MSCRKRLATTASSRGRAATACQGREGVSAKGGPGCPSSSSRCPRCAASHLLREALAPALCLLGQSSLKLCPEPSFPTCLRHSPSSWGEKAFFTHHRWSPLILCCRSGLGVTFSLAGEQTLGKASLSRDSLPALGEGTVSLALGKHVPPPPSLACVGSQRRAPSAGERVPG